MLKLRLFTLSVSLLLLQYAYSQEQSKKPFQVRKITSEKPIEIGLEIKTLKEAPKTKTKSGKEGGCDYVFQRYDECVKSCEDNANDQLSKLPCNYDVLNNTYRSCLESAQNVRNNCYSDCSEQKAKTVKTCKETKKEEIKKCRKTKKETFKQCKRTKKDAIKACKSLSGKDKRECKKNARKDKRECKKNARKDKKQCIKTAKEVYSTCLEEAENIRKTCVDDCNQTYQNACIEEENNLNECNRLRKPILDEKDDCIKKCEEERDLLLAACNYDPKCPNDVAGEAGTKWIIENTSSDKTFYIYRPGSGIYMEMFATIPPGGKIEILIPCGPQLIPYIAKDRQTEGSDYTGHSGYLYGDCCETETSGYWNLY